MESSTLLGRIRNRPKASATALGAIYLHECPREHYIPIYLIVVGAFGVFNILLSCLPCINEPEEGTSNPLSTIYKAWNLLIMFFAICWVIAGNVWIYSIYQPNYDKNTTDVSSYCNKTLYLFAFWMFTAGYILSGLFFLCCPLVLICCCLCGRADPDDNV
ncbi:transmembrane protein 272-like [Oreochromis aureus]|uniref:transmembrane protein 272-like n=1 Tax=Oreochromis aureus TaxID=47969 RepID=UPI0019540045|nr:transmembrane protein 272-like [Oreochromis aureus]